MAPKWIIAMIALIALTIPRLLKPTTAQSTGDCTNVLITMSSCLDYVSGNNPAPSVPCCSAFANVVKTSPHCLCVIVNGGGPGLGVSINQTRALELPKMCRVQTPPVSKCSEANQPSSAPAPAFTPQGSQPPAEGSETGPSSGRAPGLNSPISIVAIVLLFITMVAFNN